MKHCIVLLTLLGCLGLAGCSDYEEKAITADEAQDRGIPEGGPERDATETDYEAAAPEWQEREAGEIADGDQ